MTRLGKPKDAEKAIIYARSNLGEPLLVGQDYGAGRVLAFGGDTTHRWTRDPEGLYAHSRFWKQLVLWLARQEESEGNAFVKLDTRRLASGSQVGFTVGLRGKGGVEIPDARFDVKVIGPDGLEAPTPTARDRNEEPRHLLEDRRAGRVPRGSEGEGQGLRGQGG